MDDRHHLTLREAEPGSPPDLLDRIKIAINDLYDQSASSDDNFAANMEFQPNVRASELKTKALRCLSDLDTERKELIEERDQLRRENRQRMYELQTERLEVVINSLARLKELGADVRMEVFVEPLIQALADTTSSGT